MFRVADTISDCNWFKIRLRLVYFNLWEMMTHRSIIISLLFCAIFVDIIVLFVFETARIETIPTFRPPVNSFKFFCWKIQFPLYFLSISHIIAVFITNIVLQIRLSAILIDGISILFENNFVPLWLALFVLDHTVNSTSFLWPIVGYPFLGEFK